MAEKGEIDSRRPSPGSAPARESYDFRQVLAIADALPMGLAFVGRDHRYRFINTALADFFEQPREQILGKTMDEMLGAEAMEVRAPRLESALLGERTWFSAEYAHPSRGLLTIQSDYLPQRASDGTIEGVVILVNDVTEQRIAEQALKESEARFRRIANSAPAMMWVTRLDRTRDFVNDAYADFLCLERESAKTFDWRGAVHPDDAERVIAESVAGEASEKPFTLEARFRRGDGAYRWLKSVSQPRFGPDGKLVGFIGVATDITDSKEAELVLKRTVAERTEQLGESEHRFRAMFDSVSTVIALLDPEGGVIDINRTPAPWRSGAPEEAVGEKIWDTPTMRNYPESQPVVQSLVERSAGGETIETSITLEAPGFPRADLALTIQPILGPASEVQYLLLEARDITELKAAQDQLRQSQKMEALGQLTGGIAHDFNNLLTVVVGGLDIIAKRVEDERLKRYAQNALTAAERGARLTAQLLAFSRVQRLEVKPVRVGPVIEGMRPLLRNVIGAEIEKVFDLSGDPWPVMADPTQLELAVLNLAINARDAMPDGGTLTIATHHQNIEGDGELPAGEYVELCVADTGTGMDRDVLARAFEPFFTTKEVGKGTGLGLSMVYGVARQSGGTVRIDSEPGKGTTVRLYFRRADENAAGDSDEERSVAAQSRQRSASILVIDDDPDVRDFIVDSLGDLGHRVRHANDGPSGLKAFADEAPDLVILDFAMPGMNGGDVASRILKKDPGQPILFVSGYSESEVIRRVAPDAPILAKPFRPPALAAAVRSALADGSKRGR